MVDAIGEYEGKQLVDVARDSLDLPQDETAADELNKEHEPLLERIGGVLADRVEKVNVSQRLVDSPACVVAGEQDLNPQVRRMLESTGQQLPESKPILEVNVGHPLVTRLSAEADEATLCRSVQHRA